jgi:hypothetical protein
LSGLLSLSIHCTALTFLWLSGLLSFSSRTGWLSWLALVHGETAVIGAWQWLVHGVGWCNSGGWCMAVVGAWQWLVHGSGWYMAVDGAWQWMVHGSSWGNSSNWCNGGWGTAVVGAWQWMVHGSGWCNGGGWGTVVVGAWQWLGLHERLHERLR